MLTSDTGYLPLHEWQSLAKAHREKVRKWTVPYRSRKASHQQHPVLDFLFTYYPFSLGRLEQWHPGFGIKLGSNDQQHPQFQHRHYQCSSQSITLNADALSDKETHRLKWVHNLLCLSQTRTPNFACHGLHEWAMVYQGQDIRHQESTPLRLPQEQIDQLVSSRTITCSHFDAYRFFTPSAIELNKLKPALHSRQDFEQCGCLHTNMDLYKWASKCMPWVGSKLLWDCFQLALKARELDMRASPYDLYAYGYEPIKIETKAGRTEYETQQRQISLESGPLRQQLIDTISQVLVAKVSKS
ncbi:MAG: 3-methyladenine DNA glycosylase [Akkermansiaceae bacterium]